MENDASTISLRTRLLIDQLNKHLFGKEQSIKLALLSAIAGESIFFLGPPGVAKSMIARRLKFAFSNAKSFEYLMGKFSTPDEVFGPVSIKKLKDEDKYERIIDNYLPGAHIVFLDEIWKASPAIQNSLLTVINEKIYRNGEQEISVNLRGLVAASNELPQRGEGLDALWDRFLIRLVLENIEDEQLFNQMIVLPDIDIQEDLVKEQLKITDEEFYKWQSRIVKIQVPPHILGIINHIKASLHNRNESYEPYDKIYISDRRWRKIVKLMRTSAFLNGREAVEVMDCFIIPFCIWQHPKQREEVTELVKGSISDFGFMRLIHTTSIRQEIEQLKKEIDNAIHKTKTSKKQRTKFFNDTNQAAYVHLLEFWSEDNVFIRGVDLEKIHKNGETYIPVFEKSGKVFRPFQTYPFVKAGPFLLKSKNKAIPIETETIEEEEVQLVIPSEEQIKIWDRRIQILLEVVDNDLSILEKQRDKESRGFAQHIFVPVEYAQIVHQSMQRAVNDVLNTRLEIEKIQDSYVSIEQD